jgi:error-prone DNA polymerase
MRPKGLPVVVPHLVADQRRREAIAYILYAAVSGSRTPPAAQLEEGETISADHASLNLTLRRHPVALLREWLSALGICRASKLWAMRNGAVARVTGLTISRQRPGSAEVIFVTLEDESGHVNVIVRPAIAEAQRLPLLQSRLVMMSGTAQQENNMLHLIAESFMT